MHAVPKYRVYCYRSSVVGISVCVCVCLLDTTMSPAEMVPWIEVLLQHTT